ncbi:hypothetical protein AN641_02485 [Candidatus Epulonipiscioides gigas]|nr:hypothetical protein AN641_02485 [Epulopiscium sp. SCG-C07WGA-EpuloA2]
MKKKFSYLLISTMLLQANAPMTIMAGDQTVSIEKFIQIQENDEKSEIEPVEIFTQEYELIPSFTWSTDYATIEDSLYQAFVNIVKPAMIDQKAEIDISSLNITSEQMKNFYTDLRTNDPKLFHAGRSWSWSTSNNFVANLLPHYDEHLQANYDYYDKLITDEIAKIVALTESGTTNLDKLLIVSDYIATNYEYDQNLFVENGIEVRDCARFVEEKRGVCEGYADFAKLVLNALNIPNITVTSTNLNHIWNMVEYENEWYHIDFTWNDPKVNLKGNAHHTNFMISSAKKHELNKSADDWSSSLPNPATNTKYEGKFSVTSAPFVFIGDKSYYLDSSNDNSGIYSMNTSDGTSTLVSEVLRDAKWYIPAGGSFYTTKFSGFAGKDGFLYYNTPNSIMAYSISGNTSTQVDVSIEQPTDHEIWGFNLSGNQLTYTVDADITIEENGLYKTGIITLPTGSVDKTALSELIISSNANYDSVDISEDGLDVMSGKNYVTSAEAKEFSDLIATAQGIVDKTNATQLEVDNATTTLFNANRTFHQAKKEAPVRVSLTVPGIEGGQITINRATGTILAADDTITSANIPSVIQGATITSIDDFAFSRCTNLTRITLPDTITSIGQQAFQFCSSLIGLTLPEGVTSIAPFAFYKCTGLREISIPASVTSIGSEFVRDCTALETVYFGGTQAQWTALEVTLPTGVTMIYIDTTAPVITVTYDETEYTDDFAFSTTVGATDPDLTVAVSDNVDTVAAPKPVVKKVGDNTFNGGIDTITNAEGTYTITYTAKDNSDNTATLVVTVTVEVAADVDKTALKTAIATATTNLASATVSVDGSDILPDDKWVTQIDYDTFEVAIAEAKKVVDNANATQADVNNAKTALETANRIFEDAKEDGTSTDTWIAVDGIVGGKILFDPIDGVIVKAEETVTVANIPRIIDGITVTSIGNTAFRQCAELTTITLPDSITSIGMAAFFETKIEAIKVPDSVTSIGDMAFNNCKYLVEVILPAGITLGEEMFFNNYKLSVIYYGGTKEQWDALNVTVSDRVLIICETTETDPWITVDGIKGGKIKFNIPNKTIIAAEKTITTANIPTTIDGTAVERILNSVFEGHTNVTEITIPDGFTSMPALAGCENLDQVTIPTSVTTMDDVVLVSCDNLSTINYKGTYSQWSSISKSEANLPAGANIICTDTTGLDTWIDVAGIEGGQVLFNNTTGMIVDVKPTVTVANIPETINNIDVTSIGYKAFSDCNNLTTVTTPETAQNLAIIGNYAFYNCSSLSNIELGDLITKLGEFSFSKCGMSVFRIPDGVTVISDTIIADCNNLTGLVLFGDNITEIPEVFPESLSHIYYSGTEQQWNSLNLTVPNTITIMFNSTGPEASSADKTALKTAIATATTNLNDTDISTDGSDVNVNDKWVTQEEHDTFKAAIATAQTVVDNANATQADVDNAKTTLDTATTTFNSVKEDGTSTDTWIAVDGIVGGKIQFNSTTGAIVDAQATITSANIPSTIDNAQVTSISEYAFESCTNLTTITLPNSITSIGNAAFRNCSSLESITLPNAITSISNELFSGCQLLTNITLPDSITSIGWGAFNNCGSLTSITLPASITSIKEQTFSYCGNLASIEFLGNITTIENNAFNNCNNLTTITLPDSLTTIGNNAFKNCSSLTTITLPDALTSMGNNAFSQCSSLTTIDLSNSLTEIPSSSFSDCSSLTTITLPNTITNIDSNAFENCSSLATITLSNALTDIQSAAFKSCSSLTTITLPNSFTGFSDEVFKDCTKLKTIIIPASIEAMGRDTFENVSREAKIYYEGTKTQWFGLIPPPDVPIYIDIIVESTGVGTGTDGSWNDLITVAGIEGGKIKFDEETGTILRAEETITAANIPAQINSVPVTAIGNYAFSSCTKLSEVTLADSITLVGIGAFKKCSSLTEIIIPDFVTKLEYSAFEDCTSLETVQLSEKLTRIDLATFEGCSNLTTINLPNSITTIGALAFRGCYSLTTITLPTELKSIGYQAFESCTGLETIVLPDNLVEMEYWLFRYCEKLASIVIPASATTIGKDIFDSCAGLKTIYYGGTQAQWNALSVTIPQGTTVEYEYTATDTITFSRGGSTENLTAPIALNKGDTFTEPEVKATINGTEGSALTGAIAKISGKGGATTIDTSKVGSYTLTYTATDGTTTKTLVIPVVIMLDKSQEKPYFDLNGNTTNHMLYGKEAENTSKNKFSPAVVAVDAKDGDLYNNQKVFKTVVKDGKTLLASTAVYPGGVNNTQFMDEAGVFEFDYTVTDADDNTISIKANAVVSPELVDSSPIDGTPIFTVGGKTITSWPIIDANNSNNTLLKSEINKNLPYAPTVAITNVADQTDYRVKIFKDYAPTALTIADVTKSEGIYDIVYTAVADADENKFGMFAERITVVPAISDKTELIELIKTVKENLDSVDVSTDGKDVPTTDKWVTQANKDALSSAITSAQALVDNVDATQAEVDAMETTLTTANTTFNDAKQDGTASGTEIWLTVDGVVGGKLKFDKSTGTITDAEDGITTANIPATIEGAAVKAIKYEAFYEHPKVTSVTVPGSVTSVADYTFRECPELTTVVLSEGVTSIGNTAFYDCEKLSSVTLPNTLTTITDGAFQECIGLTSITIPATVKALPKNMFTNCSGLTSITLSTGLTSIGDSAFEGCTKLATINIPTGVTSIGKTAFKNCSALATIALPNSVTSISDEAFVNCSALTTIQIPTGVTAIAQKLFMSCSGLTSITLPNTLTSIGANAFYECSSLTSLSIPNSVTSIGAYSFAFCSGLTQLTLPNSVTSAGANAFVSCTGLTKITLSSKMTAISDNLLGSCSSLATVVIPESIVTISTSAFTDCTSLATIYYGGTQAAWTSSGATVANDVVVIFNSDSSVDKAALGTAIKTATQNLESTFISTDGSDIFTNNKWVTQAVHDTLKNAIATAQGVADDTDATQTQVNAAKTTLETANTTFNNAKAAGSAKEAWIEVDSIVGGKIKFNISSGLITDAEVTITTLAIPKIINGITVLGIGANTFEDCTALKTVTLPDSVTSIGASAFSGCSALTTITMLENITSIGANAFEDCTTLSAITIPTTVTSIGAGAFSGCSALINVTIPDAVTAINNNLFKNCSALKTVTMSDTVTSIGESALNGCSALTKLIISADTALIAIGDDADIQIPASVTSIGANAFNGCSTIITMSVPSGVTSIGADFVKGCSELTTIYFDGTTATWTAFNLTVPENTTVVCNDSVGDKTELNNLIQTVTDNLNNTAISTDGSDVLTTNKWVVQSVHDTLEEAIATAQAVSDKQGATVSDIETAISTLTTANETFNSAKKSGTSDGYVTVTGIVGGRVKFDPLTGKIMLAENTVTSANIPKTINSITVKIIGSGAFYNCSSLTSVTLPDSVTAIEYMAFQDCSSLTEITIPKTVTSIGDKSFTGCSSLATIYFGGNKAQWTALNVTIPEDTTVEYADTSADKTALETMIATATTNLNTTAISTNGADITPDKSWVTQAEHDTLKKAIVAAKTVMDDTDATQEEVDTAKSTLETANTTFNNTKEAGTNADSWITVDGIVGGQIKFDPNTGKIVAAQTTITSANIPSIINDITVLGICDFAFQASSNLTTVTLPDTMTSIDNYAFDRCTKLTSLSLSDSIVSIGTGAFKICSSLTNVVIPEGIRYISESTFSGCEKLATVTLPSTLVSIWERGFESCSSLESIELPDGFENLGKSSFAGCTSLTTMAIPASIALIDIDAITSFTNLETIYFGGTKERWDEFEIELSKDTTVICNVSQTILTNLIATAKTNKDSVKVSTDGADVYTYEKWVTQAEKDALQTAINTAQGVADDADATAKEISDAITALTTANTTFEQAKEAGKKPVDKTALTNLIATAKTNKDSVKVSSTDGADVYTYEKWVTQAEKDALQTAINTAQGVADDADATAKEISDAITALTTANNTFEQAKEAGTKAADKTALKTAITNANTNLSGVEISVDGMDIFTYDNWVTQAEHDTFKAAIETAQVIFDKTGATSQEITDAITALETATNTFNTNKKEGKKIADKEALKTVISGATTNLNSVAISLDGYDVFINNKWVTQAEYDAFEEAIETAQTVFDDTDSTSQEISDAISFLEVAENIFENAKEAGLDKIVGTWITVEGIEGGQIKFDVITGTITDSKDTITVANIPSTINNVTVKKLGTHAFSSNNNLTKITIPNTVTAIDNYALASCKNLQEIILSNILQNIGTNAFFECTSLEQIIFPVSVSSVGNLIFGSCSNLNTIYYGGTEEQWNKLNVLEYAVRPYVTIIYGSTGPTDPNGWIEVPGIIGGRIRFENGVITDAEDTITIANIPSKINGIAVTTIGDSAFYQNERLEAVTIPSTITSIEQHAFGHCTALETAFISEGTKMIGYMVFYNCSSLETMSIPKSVTTVGGQLLAKTDNLALIYYGGNKEQWIELDVYVADDVEIVYGSNGGVDSNTWREVEGIEGGMIKFDEPTQTIIEADSHITIANIPTKINGITVKQIGDNAFEQCIKLTELTIPSSVTSIGDNAFKNCARLEEISILDGVSSIGNNAFEKCYKLERLSLPNSVTSIGMFTFANCENLIDITLPSNLNHLGASVFRNCTKLESITNIPNSITSISYETFWGCSKLEMLVIPESVTSIGDRVFNGCDSLEVIYFGGTKEEWEDMDVLMSNDIMVLFRTTEDEQNPDLDWDTEPEDPNYAGSYDNWLFVDGIEGGRVQFDSLTGEIIAVEGTVSSAIIPYQIDGVDVTAIGSSAFYGCSILETVEINASITAIGDNAFANCSHLIEIDIPSSVEYLGDNAFYNCINLENIYIPENITSIGYRTFYGCDSLQTLSIPGVNYIGDYAFTNARSLKNISLDNVTYIGNYAFEGCSSLSQVTFSESLEYIGVSVFENCRSLKNVTIPSRVSYISDRAFLGCNNLTSITLPDELDSIGNAVFAYCSNLQTISFPDSLTSIGDDIFIGTRITSIDISTNVTYIGYNSFVDEFTINYAGTQTQWDENELETNISGNFIVTVL